MNILEQARISQMPLWKRTYLIRQERMKSEGSETFNWTVPATAAGATSVIETDTQFPRSRKYAPLNYCELVNNDSVDVELQINGSKIISYTPAGVITTIKGPVRQVGIKNLDGAAVTTLNKIKVMVKREPLTIDEWAREKKI